ncbi:MAG: IPT/TIG domain-containing protein [Rhodothermales bacterium]
MARFKLPRFNLHRFKLHSLFCVVVLLCVAAAGSANANEHAHVSKLAPQIFVGELNNVGSTWQTVTLPSFYSEMVVVASPAYTADDLPAVTRIRNAQGNSFEIRVQNPSGQALSGYAVQYLVVEAGLYTLAEHGITMEAARVVSSITDYNTSWIGELNAFQHAYTDPVVLGQVMSFNDERWSVFWSRGLVVSTPPGLGVFYTGKHVGEDQNRTRSAETIGYVVLEASSGFVDGYSYEAIAGADIVGGMDSNPPYSYSHGMDEDGYAVVSQAAMDGFNGSWAVLWGDEWLEDERLLLASDEDQTADEERVHSTEQVHAVIFNVVQSPPQLLSFSPDTGVIGEEVTLFGNFLGGTLQVLFNGVPAQFNVLTDQSLQAFVPQGASSGPVTVVTAAGQATSSSPFTLLNAPQIFSFAPEEGPRGSVVEITGQNFIEVQDVSFGGWSSKSYEVVSDTRIIATVPFTSNTGRIRVRNEAGMATTPEVFTIIPTAAVDDIVPDRASVSSIISIRGAGFLDVETIEFAGGVEAEFVILSDGEIQVTVPGNSSSGPVNVVFEDGTVVQGPVDFTLTFAEPLQGLNLCRLTDAQMAQSSTGAPFAQAGKACDGVTNGTFQSESFTNTASENEAWWEVDLGGVYNISEVAVWNRVDCCKEDLSDFFVFVSDIPFASTDLLETLGQASVTSQQIASVDLFESIDLERTGRYVRIQKQGAGTLVLAEVEIVSGSGNVSTGVDAPSNLQEAVVLDNAYPSPFRVQTNITYHLEKTGYVYLGVYDVLGREVQVLQEGVKPAGAHQALFNAADLPDGVYFYRLQSEAIAITKSVVLAR